jgi:predicted metal-dependent peptidase
MMTNMTEADKINALPTIAITDLSLDESVASSLKVYNGSSEAESNIDDIKHAPESNELKGEEQEHDDSSWSLSLQDSKSKLAQTTAQSRSLGWERFVNKMRQASAAKFRLNIKRYFTSLAILCQ